jgi:hypothetical protein
MNIMARHITGKINELLSINACYINYSENAFN